MNNTNSNKYDTIILSLQNKWEKDMNNIPQPKWEIPKYSGSQIRKSGKIIARAQTDEDKSTPEYLQAIQILNNWRASHSYPLHVITMNLRNNYPRAIVAQRLKRLDSIVGKLNRKPTLNLYKMQDLGGCRVIIDTIEGVYNVVNSYKNSRIRHKFMRENDYIENPKSSGYRCYHLIYEYHSDKVDTYNTNQLIEIQVRTKLQHIWATAVEMMGVYTKTNLKASQGNEDYLRFFLLASSMFAIMEGTPTCPNTPCNQNDIISEMKLLNKKHNIVKTLSAINIAVKYNTTDNIKNGYYLLRLDMSDNVLHIDHYKNSEIVLATNIYDEIEKINDPNINSVLVSTKSLSSLREAYPNYFVDISKFIKIIQEKLY